MGGGAGRGGFSVIAHCHLLFIDKLGWQGSLNRAFSMPLAAVNWHKVDWENRCVSLGLGNKGGASQPLADHRDQWRSFSHFCSGPKHQKPCSWYAGFFPAPPSEREKVGSDNIRSNNRDKAGKENHVRSQVCWALGVVVTTNIKWLPRDGGILLPEPCFHDRDAILRGLWEQNSFKVSLLWVNIGCWRTLSTSICQDLQPLGQKWSSLYSREGRR